MPQWGTMLAWVGVIGVWMAWAPAGAAAPPEGYLDFSDAVVAAPGTLTAREQKAVRMLVKEVAVRTRITWDVAAAAPNGAPSVAVHPAPGKAPAEGYTLRVTQDGGAPTVHIEGNDERGTLYAIGRLLREMRLWKDAIHVPGDLNITTAPSVALRGHQTGFRPKVNSYDGWTVPMWEQYMFDMAVFGINAIEFIPPRSDDADESPHFPLPKIDMMREMSRLADEFGLDVWIWYPALDRDYTDPATVEFALKEWGDVFKELPRIDVVFVPGGDPGHTHPRVLFDLLEKQTEVLHRTHPEAEMWMSPQSFGAEWMEEFRKLMQEEEQPWLSGIVFGPQNYIGLPELREMVPDRYPIRRYPDITHSLHSQYALPDWDMAYSVTENREVINPRPVDMAHIFRLWNHLADGYITYSEGCNDDVNKTVWSGLGWDPETDVRDILREYARYYIGPDYEESFSNILFALEENWRGPLLTNTSVDTTLQQVQAMERNASPQVLANWRFQQVVYRAYYDAYNRRRLLYETALEEEAMDVLRRAEILGADVAMAQAEAILDRAVTDPVGQDLRARVFEMAEALFQSIRMQLSVPRYDAIAIRRGANLDLIDNPLNNRLWLKAQFEAIRAHGRDRIETEGGRRALSIGRRDERLDLIDGLVNWTNPGPGGFYDDLGNPAQQPHLVKGPLFNEDPEARIGARTSHVDYPGLRTSWRRVAESRWDAPLKMRYEGLDPDGAYKIRIVYSGDRYDVQIELKAANGTVIHPFMEKPLPPKPVEFPIPDGAIENGTLELEFRQDPGRGGSGRGCQVAEVWLIKVD